MATVGNDHKLNYNKVYDNPKEYEISYVDALANLEEIKDKFKKSIIKANTYYLSMTPEEKEDIAIWLSHDGNVEF